MIQKSSNIKVNFIYQAIYQIVVIALPLITSPYVSRKIGANGLGFYSYSNSIAYYFVMIAMLGVLNYGNRAISRVRDDKNKLNVEFSSILYLHVILSIFCSIAYFFYCVFISSDKLYAYIQMAYVLSAIFDISWFYFGIEKFKLMITRSMLIKLLTVVCIFAFIKNESDVWKYCFIFSISNLISQLILWIPLKRYVSFVKVPLNDIKRHIKPIFILFIPTIAVSLYKYMDKIMIGWLSNKKQLGYYANSESVINMAACIPAALGTVMLPRMSNLVATNREEEFKRYIEVSVKYTFIMSYALLFGLVGIAEVFVPVFWGKDFSVCSRLIIILSVTIPFVSFANVIRNQYLLPKGMDIAYIKSVIAGAILNLLMNFILIKMCGAIGASFATVCAEITVCVIQVYEVHKVLKIKTYLTHSVPFFLYGIFMWVVVSIVGREKKINLFTLVLEIFIGSFIYMGMTVFHLWKTRDEIFKELLTKHKSKRDIRKD